MNPQWISWAKELQSISQVGLAFSSGNQFDEERYKRIREISAEILSSNSNLNKDKLLEVFEEQVGYSTPKVDVRGVVFKNEKILLVKEISDGKWTLPGGWADTNETPKESVTREILEESGYETVTSKLLAVYDRSVHDHTPFFPFHVYKLFFLCDLVGGTKACSSETSDVSFFAEENLPELSLSRVTPKQIRHFFRHLHNADWKTEFD